MKECEERSKDKNTEKKNQERPREKKATNERQKERRESKVKMSGNIFRAPLFRFLANRDSQ